jgi:hypothetical protein
MADETLMTGRRLAGIDECQLAAKSISSPNSAASA